MTIPEIDTDHNEILQALLNLAEAVRISTQTLEKLVEIISMENPEAEA